MRLLRPAAQPPGPALPSPRRGPRHQRCRRARPRTWRRHPRPPYRRNYLMQPAFTRGFRLHHNGRTIHGAEFPDGEVIVADDPQHGLGTAALSLADLLKGYHGARVEWAPEDEP